MVSFLRIDLNFHRINGYSWILVVQGCAARSAGGQEPRMGTVEKNRNGGQGFPISSMRLPTIERYLIKLECDAIKFYLYNYGIPSDRVICENIHSGLLVYTT